MIHIMLAALVVFAVVGLTHKTKYILLNGAFAEDVTLLGRYPVLRPCYGDGLFGL